MANLLWDLVRSEIGAVLMPWALAIPEVPLTNTLETDGVNPNDNFRALTLGSKDIPGPGEPQPRSRPR
jgi:hypothetical protein